VSRAQRSLAYVLRLWRVGGSAPAWRISLHNARTRERRGFADLAGLAAFLVREMNGEGRHEPEEPASPARAGTPLHSEETTMSEDAETELRRLNRESFRAEDQRAAERLGPILADDFRIVRATYAVEDKATMLARIAADTSGRRREVSDEQVQLYGDSAVVTSLVTLREPTGEVVGHFWNTKLFVRGGAGWQCAIWQVARIAGEVAVEEPNASGRDAVLRGMGELLSDDAVLLAFKQAAFNDDLWQQAQADPRGYFGGVGVTIPDVLDIAITGHQALKPWPPTAPELQMVTIRCFWVWGKRDPDEGPVKPVQFYLEVPSILLPFVRR